MSGPTVDIAVACAQSQYSKWWANVVTALLCEQKNGVEIGQIMAISSAVPDYNKNNMIGGGVRPVMTGAAALANPEEKRRNNLTDANRGAAASRFMSGSPSGWKSEWLFWMDDDTVPPTDVISRLLAMGQPACAGLYFNTNPPHNPIAYVKDPNGIGYQALYDYPYGAMIPVDSVGMGCTLIHRSVFERIMDAHAVYQRPNGSLFPIHKSRVQEDDGWSWPDEAVTLIGDRLVQRVLPPTEDDNRAWPFFALEYGRTEDHHFWELAAAVGVRPWIDTALLCEHIKPGGTTYDRYREQRMERIFTAAATASPEVDA